MTLPPPVMLWMSRPVTQISHHLTTTSAVAAAAAAAAALGGDSILELRVTMIAYLRSVAWIVMWKRASKIYPH